MQARCAVSALKALMGSAQRCLERVVMLGVVTGRAFVPRIKATARYAQDVAQTGHGVTGSVLLDKRKDQFGLSAKNRRAFFRMSISSSRASRVFSSC